MRLPKCLDQRKGDMQWRAQYPAQLVSLSSLKEMTEYEFTDTTSTVKFCIDTLQRDTMIYVSSFQCSGSHYDMVKNGVANTGEYVLWVTISYELLEIEGGSRKAQKADLAKVLELPIAERATIKI